MIIILEGPECAGKSTLAHQLSKQTGFEIVHRDKPKTEQEKEQMMQMYIEAIRSGDNVIFDRCWYSEMVYGEVMRDKSYITDTQMLYLEQLLAEKGGMIIHCTDAIETLWKRCEIRGEDYITDIYTLALIKDKFDYVMRQLPHIIPVFTFTINVPPTHV